MLVRLYILQMDFFKWPLKSPKEFRKDVLKIITACGK